MCQWIGQFTGPANGGYVAKGAPGVACQDHAATCLQVGYSGWESPSGIKYRNVTGLETANFTNSNAGTCFTDPPPPQETPNAPQSITVTPGHTTLTVAWTPPDYPGTSAISQYRVVPRTRAGVPVSLPTCTTTSLSCTFTNLTNNVTYTFTVYADNATATSPPTVVGGQPIIVLAPVTPGGPSTAPPSPASGALQATSAVKITKRVKRSISAAVSYTPSSVGSQRVALYKKVGKKWILVKAVTKNSKGPGLSVTFKTRTSSVYRVCAAPAAHATGACSSSVRGR